MKRTILSWWWLCILLGILAVAVLSAADAPAPFTDLESARIENVNLRRALVQQQIDDLTARVAKLKADLEAVRPGWTWTPDTGAWVKKEKT